MPDAGGSFASVKSCPPPCARRTAPADRVRIRAACESDLAQIAAIWNFEVLGTDATTDTEPRSLAAQREWLARHTERYPVVVAAIASDDPERDEDVLAYGALSPYQSKWQLRAEKCLLAALSPVRFKLVAGEDEKRAWRELVSRQGGTARGRDGKELGGSGRERARRPRRR